MGRGPLGSVALDCYLTLEFSDWLRGSSWCGGKGGGGGV